MYDIKELEKEWQRYRRKKKRPWYILFVASVLLSVLFIFLYKHKTWKTFRHAEINQSDVRERIADTVYLSPAIVALAHKEKDSPSIDNPLGTAPKNVPEGKKEAKHANLNIEVTDIDTNKAYREVENRFRLSHDTADSLFLAKAYYRKGKYKKSEYWALQTNKVNDRIEESWLIFIQAKLKQGQKNEAIRILNAYIDKTNSAEAKILLQKVKEGKI